MNKLVYTGSYKLLATSFKPQAKKLATCSLWLAAILVLTAASCKKEEEPRHRDVFRCEINGVPWEAECESTNLVFGCSAIDCLYYPDNGSFTLLASNKVLNNGFRIRKTSLDGGLNIGQNTISSIHFGRSDTLSNECTLFNIFNPNIKLNIIEINKNEKIIIGNIDIIYLLNSCSDSIKIAKVDFSIKYRP